MLVVLPELTSRRLPKAVASTDPEEKAGTAAAGSPSEPVRPRPSPLGGLSRQQLMMIGAALVAVVVIVIIVLAARGDDKSALSGGGGTATTKAASAGDQFLEQGLAAQTAGRLDEARGLYLKAIEKDPTNKLAYYDLGVIYQQLNAVGDARTNYRKALQIDAKYQPALFNLAVLETPGNPAEAVSLYQKILAINPNDANVHLNLGLVLKQMGRNGDGDAELARAIQLNPALASRLPK